MSEKMTVREMFDKCSDEYEYESRELSGRDDLKAFAFLDKLCPGDGNMVASAGHDQIWLDVSLDDLEDRVTIEDVKQLYVWGVFYDIESDSLSMFV